MISSFMVMTVGEDGTAEGVLQEDVDATFVCDDMAIKLLVGESRLEGCGDVLQG